MQSTEKYCEGCAFFQSATSGISYARCTNAQAIPVNTGDRFVSQSLDKPPFCSTMRMMESQCGPEGKWFAAAKTPKGHE